MVQRQPVLGEQWVLTGREPLLREVVESVTAGGGVVLCGPSGVGKTRLAREALKRLKEAGWRAEWIAATQAASAIPLGAMSHLLPRDCHTLPEVLHGTADQWAGGATVVAVDDAHLLDAASATVVHHLALHAGVPMVVTMRYRERCLDAVTALWKEGLARRIEVPAVTGEAVGELLDQTFGEALDGASRRWLARVSEGNPLLLREILRAGLDTRVLRSRNGLWRWEGPVRPTTRLVEVVTAWLGSVSRAVARVVELAALGEPLPVSLLARLCDAEAVAEAESVGLLLVEGSGRRGQARLEHPLYGEVIRSAMLRAKAAMLAGELAGALSATPMRRADDALRVGVWRLRAGGAGGVGEAGGAGGVGEAGSAGRVGEAGGGGEAKVMLDAAKQALRRFDVTLAARLAAAARDAGGGRSAEQMLAQILSHCGWYEESVRALPDKPVDASERVRWAIARADIYTWGLGRVNEAERALEEAGTATGRDSVHAYRSLILMFDSRCTESQRLGEQVLDRAEAEPQAVIWAAVGASASAGFLGDHERARGGYGHGWRVASERPDAVPWGRVQVGCAYCMGLLAMGRVDEALELAAGEYRAAARAAIPEPLGVWAGFYGAVAKARGDLAGASRLLRESLTLLARYDTFRLAVPCLAALAGTYALRADDRRATRLIAYAERPDQRVSRLFLPWIGLDRAWTYAARGDTTAAAGAARHAAALARELGQPTVEAWALYDTARLGDAGSVHARLAELAETCGGPAPAAFARAAEALSCDDASELERAATEFQDLGLLLHAAEAAVMAGLSHRRAGRPSRANQAAERATALVELCPDAVTPLLSQATFGSALTRRERDIAGLAATGRSSKRIAEQLGLSPRTVDNHLSRVYVKLGVNGRDQLPGWKR